VRFGRFGRYGRFFVGKLSAVSDQLSAGTRQEGRRLLTTKGTKSTLRLRSLRRRSGQARQGKLEIGMAKFETQHRLGSGVKAAEIAEDDW
jgi:hypothetical protein